MHLRIDTIETVLKTAFPNNQDMEDKGYRVAYEMAKDNLRLGNTVIADSVNPIDITRQAWRDVAIKTSKKFLEIELICSKSSEHKKRIETRSSDIKGLTLPTWEKVQTRDYEPWDLKGLRLDTSILSPEECVEKIIKHLRQ